MKNQSLSQQEIHEAERLIITTMERIHTYDQLLKICELDLVECIQQLDAVADPFEHAKILKKYNYFENEYEKVFKRKSGLCCELTKLQIVATASGQPIAEHLLKRYN